LQDQFSEFATDLQALKAHIIVTQYDDNTIIERSNIMRTPDAQLVPEAIALLRSNLRDWRIKVRPEDLAITDYATLKAERSEALTALASFIPQIVEANEAIPGSLPFLLEMMKWGLMGFRGINTIEGVIDQAVEAAKQQAQQPPEPEQPDPTEQLKMQTEQVKAQAQGVQSQAQVQTAQTNLQRTQVEATKALRETQIEARVAAMTGIPGFNGPPQ
jgi:multidrug efflux pump subunit AcrB